ncbi:MAG: hypothetical protein J6T72_03355 [Alphaproteobacteria bacterium]|nr:hypothetical protein [Alphaproteobacteria bacterium]
MNRQQTNQINKLKDFEKYFAENYYFGAAKSKSVFSYMENNSRVCLTAPHSTKSTVSRLVKGSDLYTGSLVKYLGETCNLSYIVRNKYYHKKCMLSSFILKNNLEQHYFLDIHAMKDRPFDLAVGIGYCSPKDYEKELLLIKKLCKKYQLKYVVNHPAYTGQRGLTGKLQHQLSKAAVLQLEWSKKFRDFEHNPNEVTKITLPFIKELALNLNKLNKRKLSHKITAKYTLWQRLKNRIVFLLSRP